MNQLNAFQNPVQNVLRLIVDVVRPDEQNDRLQFRYEIHLPVQHSPKDVLRRIAADSEIDAMQRADLLVPQRRELHLVYDRVADEDDLRFGDLRFGHVTIVLQNRGKKCK